MSLNRCQRSPRTLKPVRSSRSSCGTCSRNASLFELQLRRFMWANLNVIFALGYRSTASAVESVPVSRLPTLRSLWSCVEIASLVVCRWCCTVAAGRKGLQTTPKGTPVERNSCRFSACAVGVVASFSHKNRVTSRSGGCRPICRNAFSM